MVEPGSQFWRSRATLCTARRTISATNGSTGSDGTDVFERRAGRGRRPSLRRAMHVLLSRSATCGDCSRACRRGGGNGAPYLSAGRNTGGPRSSRAAPCHWFRRCARVARRSGDGHAGTGCRHRRRVGTRTVGSERASADTGLHGASNSTRGSCPVATLVLFARPRRWREGVRRLAIRSHGG